MKRYQVVVADPGWSFADKLPGRGRGAAKKYNVHDGIAGNVEALAAGLAHFDAELAEDWWLVCWRVSSQVPVAYDLVRAWQCADKSEFVWVKYRQSGKRHTGMGRSVRLGHECAIIAKHGRPPVARHDVPSVIEAPMPVHSLDYCGLTLATCPEPDEHKDGKLIHSAKPDLFYTRVEQLFGDVPRLELFARRRRVGWDCYGDELVARERTQYSPTEPRDEEFERLMAAHDAIGALCYLVKKSGATMTLNGQPVDATQLRAAATGAAIDRIHDVLTGGKLSAEERAERALAAITGGLT